MRFLILAPVLAVLAVLPAMAQTRLDGARFEALVEGKTLYYKSLGRPYGAEQYTPDRGVVWRFEGTECQRGIWYEPLPERICFVYEAAPEPQCWHFYETEGEISAQFLFQGQESGTRLQEIKRSDQPIDCEGPYVGA